MKGCIGISGTPTAPTLPTDSVIVTVTAWVTVPFVGSQSVTQDMKMALDVFTAPDNTITATSTTLTSNEPNATAYQWLDCDNGNAPIGGETNVSFTPAAAGNYAVQVTNPCGTVTSACTAFSPAAGLSSNAIAYSIYPNPATDQFTIAFTNQQSDVAVKVYSASGQLVSSNVYSNVAKIETPIKGEAGIYIVELKVNGDTVRTKITKR